MYMKIVVQETFFQIAFHKWLEQFGNNNGYHLLNSYDVQCVLYVFCVKFLRERNHKHPDSERLSNLLNVAQPVEAEPGSKQSSARSQGSLCFH